MPVVSDKQEAHNSMFLWYKITGSQRNRVHYSCVWPRTLASDSVLEAANPSLYMFWPAMEPANLCQNLLVLEHLP